VSGALGENDVALDGMRGERFARLLGKAVASSRRGVGDDDRALD
jgi:hypothetical protein